LTGTEPILELADVTKRFGVLAAVDSVSVTVDATDTTAIIGPNGAGKTTLYNLVSGYLEATSGTIRFGSEDVTDMSVGQRVRTGLGRSFQISNVFEGLTVRRNLRIPVIARSDNPYTVLSHVSRAEDINAETDRLLELVGVRDRADEQIENLPYGDKRRVDIGVALATDPDLVLLDEPTAGMTPEGSREMTSLIRELDEGTDVAFIITEHDMDVIFSIASRILVLHNGEIIADGSAEEIRANTDVQSAYLGIEP
jgi:branched-chain amino acid transport system ATP-binding protein